MQVVSYGDTKQREVQTKTYLSRVRPYYGGMLAMAEGPQVYLVDLPEAGSTIDPHFHDVDQYQVVVRGGGRLGPGPTGPVAFHYADAYTPYGPIIGDKDGIGFFTIRTACATGYFPMPESRHLIPGKPGRNLGGQFDINKPLPAATESTREKLLEDAKDNVLVVGIRMGPNATSSGEPTIGGDQYYLLCTGSLKHEGREVPPLTMVRLERGEPTPTFEAGAKGAEVLLLQLPMPTARMGSDRAVLAKRDTSAYKLPEGAIIKS
jgi:hypothetical protein